MGPIQIDSWQLVVNINIRDTCCSLLALLLLFHRYWFASKNERRSDTVQRTISRCKGTKQL